MDGIERKKGQEEGSVFLTLRHIFCLVLAEINIMCCTELDLSKNADLPEHLCGCPFGDVLGVRPEHDAVKTFHNDQTTHSVLFLCSSAFLGEKRRK